ncbi:MAG: CHAT domain-containing protein [Aureispira sp.]|nr:CHAT domain-containing protein [Aureispira sp.]
MRIGWRLYFLIQIGVFLVSITILSAQQKNGQRRTIEELDSLIDIEAEQGNYEQAVIYYQSAIEQVRQEYGKEETYVNWLSSFALFCEEIGEYDGAESLYQQILKIDSSLAGTNSLEYSTDLANLAMFYTLNENYLEAEKLFKKALLINQEKLEQSDSKFLTDKFSLAELYIRLKRYEDAEVILEDVLAIEEQNPSKDLESYSLTLHALALVYGNLGKYIKAEEYYLKSLNLRRSLAIPDDAYLIDMKINLALMYFELGHYEEAKALHLENLEETEDKQHRAYSLNNLGLLHAELENYKAAEYSFQEALALEVEMWGKDRGSYAFVLSNLVELYINMQRYKEAEALYKEILATEKFLKKEYNPSYINTIFSLAYLYEEMEDFPNAEKLYKEALTLSQKKFGVHSHKNIRILVALAGVYDKMGNALKTEQLYLGLLNNLDSSLLGENVDLIGNLAYYYAKNGNSKAWDYSIKGLNIISGLKLSTNVNEEWRKLKTAILPIASGDALHLLKVVHMLLDKEKKENKEQQIIVVDLAIDLAKKRKKICINDKDKLHVLSTQIDWILRGIKALNLSEPNDIDKAFELAEYSKSVLVIDEMNTRKAYNVGALPDSLIDREQMLQKKYTTLAAMLLQEYERNEADSLRQALNDVSVQFEKFKDEISAQYPNYAKLKYEQKNSTITDIQEQLNVQTGLIEYVVSDSSVYIFYIDKKEVKSIYCSIGKETLINKVDKMHWALSNYQELTNDPEKAYLKYTEVAHWFYKELLQPILPKNKDIKQLIIVTDQELGYLPFETFLVEPAPKEAVSYVNLHYLMQDYKISYSYSATLWRENKISNSKKGNGLFYGAAASYDPSEWINKGFKSTLLDKYKNIREVLRPLPMAKQEVEILSKKFKGYYVFDDLATEQNFKEKGADYSIIHLAMHGMVDRKNPILSSLAFSENGLGTENNFLEAYEISKMDLSAELVVLSACETGYGEFQKGNGIASLARAFMYAGVPSLVVSLWSVNDKSTSIIMESFYQYLSEGRNKADALQQAKLDYLQNARGVAAHPAFWSPFVQLGDSEPIELATKTSWKMILGILGGLVLLIIVGAFFLRKRKAY